MTPDSFLEVENLIKNYKTGNIVLQVLKGISLKVNQGEIVTIVGPSGAGKSTLLHIMGFLDRPTGGDVIFSGQRLSKTNSITQARIRNKDFGFVFQMYHLLPELNILENTMLPLMIGKGVRDWFMSKKGLKERTLELLDRLGLSKRIRHKPSALSGGEMQRVAIARALVTDPQVVYCDEPTGSLDQTTSKEIQALILSLNKELGKTFVIVTHNPDIASIATNKLNLIDGKISSS
jgi:lipoprotein-releasing system ATP-binding protein